MRRMPAHGCSCYYCLVAVGIEKRKKMNQYDEAFYYMAKHIALIEGTPHSPIEPATGQIWKDQNDFLRMWTGKQWVPIVGEIK